MASRDDIEKTKPARKTAKTEALKAEKVDLEGIRKNSGVKPAISERFMSYVNKGRGCWQWQGSFTRDGYGQFWVADNLVVKSHRMAYELFRGKLSKEKRLKNTCGNKRCVNPYHWEITGR